MASIAPTSGDFDESSRLRAGSATSWGAIFAGAVVAIALSVVLLTLGAGLGFASVSVYADQGASASTFSMSGVVWLIVTQWLSAGVGGYVAGRLRQRWLATHWHEAYFRDTAHGMAVWSLATIATVVVVAGAAGGVARGGAHMAGAGLHGAMSGGAGAMAMGHDGPPPGAMGGGPGSYAIDKMFRAGPSGGGAASPQAGDPRMEVGHIVAESMSRDGISDDDRTYLTQLVAARANMSQDEARQRVDAFVGSVKDMQARAKADAEAARKAAAKLAIYTALAMLIGAFIASVAARLGGHARDEHQ